MTCLEIITRPSKNAIVSTVLTVVFRG